MCCTCIWEKRKAHEWKVERRMSVKWIDRERALVCVCVRHHFASHLPWVCTLRMHVCSTLSRWIAFARLVENVRSTFSYLLLLLLFLVLVSFGVESTHFFLYYFLFFETVRADTSMSETQIGTHATSTQWDAVCVHAFFTQKKYFQQRRDLFRVVRFNCCVSFFIIIKLRPEKAATVRPHILFFLHFLWLINLKQSSVQSAYLDIVQSLEFVIV